MKRRRHNIPASDQPLKKLGILSSQDSLRSKITAKLQTVLDGFVSELQNISKDKKPDVALLFSARNAVNNFDGSEIVKSTLGNNKASGTDETTLTLENFINSAKSRISGLLRKDQETQGTCNTNLLEKLQNLPPVKSKTVNIDPLQIQISLKLQSLLCKALDDNRLGNNGENHHNSTPEEVITETEWRDLSSMLHDFMSSEKKKNSNSLSNEHQLSSQQERSSTKCSDIAEQSTSHKHFQNKGHQTFSNGLSAISKQGLNLRDKNFQDRIPHSQSTRAALRSSTMDSAAFSDSFHSSGSGRRGILLMDEARRAPDYLDLILDTDVDDPSCDSSESDSDEEVVVLGEKRPTYQEITLEEDDDGEVYESVVEKELQKPPESDVEIEELLFPCPICGKTFRVESLLKFHIRMHGDTNPSSPTTSVSDLSSNTSPKEENFIENDSNSHRSYSTKEKENSRRTSSSRSHKNLAYQEKKKKFSKLKKKKSPV